MEIWLQRIQLRFGRGVVFKEAICQLVDGDEANIWNSDWISSKELKLLISSKKMVDNKMIEKLPSVIPANEIELFVSKANEY